MKLTIMKHLTITKMIRLGLLGLCLIASGRYANHLVMGNNHGKMPVWVLNDEIAYELSDDPRHTPLDGNSKDIILADVIPLPTIDTTGITRRRVG